MLTTEQLTQRRGAIGSSDMAAILGVSPWRTAYDVWLDKTGKIDPEPENPQMQAGTRFEAGVLDDAESKLGPLRRGVRVESPELRLAANLDAQVIETGYPVEAKTAGLFGPLADQWGDDGTDQVPDHYAVQAHVHMIVTKTPLCHFPAFLGGRGFVMFTVPLSRSLADLIAEKAVEFWDRNVIADTPPVSAIGSPQVLRRVRREPSKVAKVAPELVAAYNSACEQAKAAESAKAAAQAALLTAAGDAEAMDFGDVKKWFTYFESSRTSVDTDALRSTYPDIWQACAKTSAYRTLRLANKPKA